jgi:serine/threonine protein kinase
MRWAHCDLNPANILIDKHGRAKLADFGISMMATEDAVRRGGTLEFAAPELLHEGRYDPFKADVWSFGVTVYFMAFAQLPFPRPDPSAPEPVYNVADIAFPPAADPDLIDGIRAMLVRDPAARPCAVECQSMAIFSRADVRDGWMDENGNPLARPEESGTVRSTRSLNLLPERRTQPVSTRISRKLPSPVTW